MHSGGLNRRKELKNCNVVANSGGYEPPQK
jgi:hypothetical protein